MGWNTVFDDYDVALCQYWNRTVVFAYQGKTMGYKIEDSLCWRDGHCIVLCSIVILLLCDISAPGQIYSTCFFIVGLCSGIFRKISPFRML